MTNIVITGSVAVGKSFVQNELKRYLSSKFKTVIYPEFIQNVDGTVDEFAMKILEKRFKSEISPLTFQNFILDKWELIIEKNEENDNNSGEIKIYERLPDDAVDVFAKNSLNDEEYLTQTTRLIQLQDKLGISYGKMNMENTFWIRFNNQVGKSIIPLITIIEDILSKNNYENIVVEVVSSTIYENYKHRNRKEEFYTDTELINLYENYCDYTSSIISRIGCEIFNIY